MDYYADRADIDVAERIVRRLNARVAELLEFPELGFLVDGPAKNRRAIAVSPHLVVYKLEGDVIWILRVFHAAQERDTSPDDES